MSLILSIETATPVCSVALSHCGKVIFSRTGGGENDHSQVLTVFIEEICAEAGIRLSGLDAVAVSMGPGSYTGLRIGISVAKGLCYSLNKPMIAVCSLQAMALGMSNYWRENYAAETEDYLFCPMIDARRMEVYCAIYSSDNELVKPIAAEIIDEQSFRDYLSQYKVVFFGNGASKTRTLLSQSVNAIIIDDYAASAAWVGEIAERKYNLGEFEDVAYFEPYYLKDFIAGKPKVKGLKD